MSRTCKLHVIEVRLRYSVATYVRKFTGLIVHRSTRMNQATLHSNFKQLPLAGPAAIIPPTAGSLQSGMYCL